MFLCCSKINSLIPEVNNTFQFAKQQKICVRIDTIRYNEKSKYQEERAILSWVSDSFIIQVIRSWQQLNLTYTIKS